MEHLVKNGYNMISSEYYDEKHITSRNFDYATDAFFRENLLKFKKYLQTNRLCLEVGAGRGNTERYLRIGYDKIILSDINQRMLSHAPDEYLLKVITNAKETPFFSGSFQLITAFLFDPFNTIEFYKEISRILKPGGFFIGTLPHCKWGRTLRSEINIDIDKTQFILKDGTVLQTDSFLSDFDELKQYHRKNNLEVVEYCDIFLPPNTEKISDHILIPAKKLSLTPFQLPLIQFIISKKV
jgi:SAM-dependent methyltransferase